MVAATISAFVLAAVISSFLFIGRSAINIRNYTEMETEARRMLEYFAEDTRQAESVTWVTYQSIILTTVDEKGIKKEINYEYNPSTFALIRTTTGTPIVTMTNLSDLKFLAYTINGTAITLNGSSSPAALASAAIGTKQIQISLAASRTRQTLAKTTSTVLSARFILRNKKVTA
jgi:hypothetical protein